jgi:hypothetical protein
MATDADLDRIARALPGVTVGRYWDDDRAYLMERARGGRGLAQRRSPRRDEGTVDPATSEPFEDLIVVHTATDEARAEALASFPSEIVFTIPHFARSYAVLARRSLISADDLQSLLQLAWESKQRQR